MPPPAARKQGQKKRLQRWIGTPRGRLLPPGVALPLPRPRAAAGRVLRGQPKAGIRCGRDRGP
eukprot:12926557-Alexandrium_andersonii.AAC.1